MDSSHQSNDYVVSSRKIITGLQRQICTALSEGTEEYDEEDILLELSEFLKEKGVGKPMIGRVMRDLKVPLVSGVFGLKQKWPLVVFENLKDPQDIEEAQVAMDSCLVEQTPRVDPKELLPNLMAPLWYSVSANRGFRRLHRRGGCGSQPTDCLQSVQVFNLGDIRVDARCLHCFPLKGDFEEEEPGDEGSSESSSSDSVTAEDEARGIA